MTREEQQSIGRIYVNPKVKYDERLQSLIEDISEVRVVLARFGNEHYADILYECEFDLHCPPPDTALLHEKLLYVASDIEMLLGKCRAVQILERVAARLSDMSAKKV